MPTLDDVLVQLATAPPSEFIRERNALVARLTKLGQKEAAERVKAVPKRRRNPHSSSGHGAGRHERARHGGSRRPRFAPRLGPGHACATRDLGVDVPESGWATVTQELKIAAKSAKLERDAPLSAVLRFPRLSPDFATHSPTLFPTLFLGAGGRAMGEA
jgi:hypothetical protein